MSSPDMTNATRARYALDAVRFFALTIDNVPADQVVGEVLEEYTRDLLTNLIHLQRITLGMDAEARHVELDRAIGMHDEEMAEDSDL